MGSFVFHFLFKNNDVFKWGGIKMALNLFLKVLPILLYIIWGVLVCRKMLNKDRRGKQCQTVFSRALFAAVGIRDIK